MMKTNFVKRAVISRIKDLCSNAYFGNIPQECEFPRISLNLNETGSTGTGFQDYILTVYSYDRRTFENLDELTDKLEKALNNWDYRGEEGTLKIYSSHDKVSISDKNSDIVQCIQKFKLIFIEKEC
ncbi:MAG: hypothetical protein ACI4I6_06590 [Hominimerdicola sp.]